MIRKFSIINSLCFLLVCFLSSQAPALMIEMSTEELTRESETVIVGEVKDVVSYWSEDGKKILTRARVIVDEVVRGNRYTEVSVEYEGGEVGEIGLRVSDVAPLNIGEKVILFLKTKKIESGVKVFDIVGQAQGKYTVGEDGIAYKTGFCVVKDTEGVIDNSIPVEDLLSEIRRIGK